MTAQPTPQPPPRRKRTDAVRNEQMLLDAAAEVFVSSGVDAPIREIAAKAGVGLATLYRHFPTRAELVVAVYRHQVEACAEAGSALLADGREPADALRSWFRIFVDFLVTKHGLAEMLRVDGGDFGALHSYFLQRLVPVCDALLASAAAAGQVRTGYGAYELMRGVGNLCIGAGEDEQYDPRRLIDLMLLGLEDRPPRTPNG